MGNLLPLLLAMAMGRCGLADTHYAADPRANPDVNPVYPFTTPDTAAFSLFEALDVAEAGDIVIALRGAYGSLGATYTLKNGVDLVGSGSDLTTMLAGLRVGPGSMVSGFRFEDCSVNMTGGALISHCVFDGARIYVYGTGTVQRCAFVRAPAEPSRAAIEAQYGMGPSILDCVFELDAQACAIRLYLGEQPTVVRCRFAGCGVGVDWLGGWPGGRVTNCLFVGNREGIRMNASRVAVANCTFFGNEYAVSVTDQCDEGPRIESSILWGNEEADIFLEESDGFGIPRVAFSNVERPYPGRGNISVRPRFIWPYWPGGDFHLLASSPCIDAGDPFSDYSNEPEPNGGRVNMGAYGNTWEATTSELVDTDADYMRDDWEIEHFGNLDQDGFGDADDEGLSDLEEYRYLTDPHKPDTDGDGVPDGEEVLVHGTDPILADTDNDGAPDGKEVAQGTDPLDPWDAFTIIKFWIEDDKIHVVHPVQPGYWFELESSLWPNGPFGGLSSEWQGRWGVTAHTFTADLNPHTHFFRIKARPY
ncbi:MAG: right-handed parallel beta-helix repeat-containing protein [bacterium]|nr:right-handed parallel beta-helix repeat-containing protein [bacterium]